MYISTKTRWIPTAFNFCQDPDGNQWAIVDWTVSPDQVAAAINRSYFNHGLARASTHYNGLGMQHGIGVDCTFRHLGKLKDNAESDLQYKASVETIVAAAAWPNDRCIWHILRLAIFA